MLFLPSVSLKPSRPKVFFAYEKKLGRLGMSLPQCGTGECSNSVSLYPSMIYRDVEPTPVDCY